MSQNFYVDKITLCKQEVANLFGIHISTIPRWCKAGRLPLPFSIGSNRPVWDKEELMSYYENQKNNRGFHGNRPKS